MEKRFFAAADNPSGSGPPPSNQSYSITISVDQTNGTFTANPQTAEAGTVVTLTAAPATGFMFRASTMEIRGTSGDRIYTDPSVPTSLVYTFTMPAEDVTVTGEFFEIDPDVVYVTNTVDTDDVDPDVAGSLRQAVNTVQNEGTVQVELPAGSKIELKRSLNGIKKSLTIEGNGVTLTRSSTWTQGADSLLRSGYDLAVLTVRRMRFDSGVSEGNGTALRWDAELTLESCIFSNNTNIGPGRRGAAIYKLQGDAVIKGCTFYNNVMDENQKGNSAVVGFGGGNMTLTLVGNLFYKNEAPLYPIVGPGFGTIGVTVQPSYNVLDKDFGKDPEDCGWEEPDPGGTDASDKNNTLVDPATFVPYSLYATFNDAPSTDFPATDFYGKDRTFPGAPGAVNAAQ